MRWVLLLVCFSNFGIRAQEPLVFSVGPIAGDQYGVMGSATFTHSRWAAGFRVLGAMSTFEAQDDLVEGSVFVGLQASSDMGFVILGMAVGHSSGHYYSRDEDAVLFDAFSFGPDLHVGINLSSSVGLGLHVIGSISKHQSQGYVGLSLNFGLLR